MINDFIKVNDKDFLISCFYLQNPIILKTEFYIYQNSFLFQAFIYLLE